MSDALQVAAEILEVDGVEHVAELGGSRRSVVRRVRSGGQTFIVKEYLQPEEMTWSREAAGLKAAAGVRAPRLLGISEDPAVVVMSDLGSGGNLADALLGTVAGNDASGVLAWAEAIGELQAHAADRLDVFREALADGVSTALSLNWRMPARRSARSVPTQACRGTGRCGRCLPRRSSPFWRSLAWR